MLAMNLATTFVCAIGIATHYSLPKWKRDATAAICGAICWVVLPINLALMFHWL